MAEEDGVDRARPVGASSRHSLLLTAAVVVGLVLAAAAQLIDGVGKRWIWAVVVVAGSVAAIPGAVLASPWWQERRATAETARSEQRRRVAAWQLHFEPLARGVLEPHVKGSFFTGRVATLSRLATWLTDPSTGCLLVVTGRPGSGKSAILGRFVTLTQALDPSVAGPRGLPRALSIDVVLNAREITLRDLVTTIGAQLGFDAHDVSELLLRLQDRSPPAIVVLDAVNEAAEPERIAREFLGRLADQTEEMGLRVVAGVRGNLLQVVRASAAEVVDLDSKEFFEPQDLVLYVRKILEAGATDPAEAATRHVDALAGAIARRAGTAFLVAQLSARAAGAEHDKIMVLTWTLDGTLPDLPMSAQIAAPGRAAVPGPWFLGTVGDIGHLTVGHPDQQPHGHDADRNLRSAPETGRPSCRSVNDPPDRTPSLRSLTPPSAFSV